MLNVGNNPFILSIVMLSVVVLMSLLNCTVLSKLVLFFSWKKSKKMKTEKWMQRRDRQRQVSPENEKEDGFVQELENNKVF